MEIHIMNGHGLAKGLADFLEDHLGHREKRTS
jgi:hypothetical protein